jgi:hypothetical protein
MCQLLSGKYLKGNDRGQFSDTIIEFVWRESNIMKHFIRTIVNDRIEEMVAVVAYFKELSQNLSGGTK